MSLVDHTWCSVWQCVCVLLLSLSSSECSDQCRQPPVMYCVLVCGSVCYMYTIYCIYIIYLYTLGDGDKYSLLLRCRTTVMPIHYFWCRLTSSCTTLLTYITITLSDKQRVGAAMYVRIQHTSASLKVVGLKRLWIRHTCDWHISGNVGRRSVADSIACVAETPR